MKKTIDYKYFLLLLIPLILFLFSCKEIIPPEESSEVKPSSIIQDSVQSQETSAESDKFSSQLKVISNIFWIGQDAISIIENRGIPNYGAESDEGWQPFVVDIVIENNLNSWIEVDDFNGELIDTGGYSRDVYFYFGDAPRIIVPPKFRFLVTARGELPTNQQLSELSIQIGDQILLIDLKKKQEVLKELNPESSISDILQNIPTSVELANNFSISINNIRLVPRLKDNNIIVSEPILNVEIENIGGYDLLGDNLNNQLLILGIDQNGYYTKSDTIDRTISIPPGSTQNGFISLQPFVGTFDYAFIIVGLNEEQTWSWCIYKVNGTKIQEIWDSIQIEEVSEVRTQLNDDGGTDYLNFDLTLTSNALEDHDVEVKVIWEETTGSPNSSNCSPNYRETKVETQIETENIKIGPGETLKVPFEFDYWIGHCLSATGVIKIAEITKIDGFTKLESLIVDGTITEQEQKNNEIKLEGTGKLKGCIDSDYYLIAMEINLDTGNITGNISYSCGFKPDSETYCSMIYNAILQGKMDLETREINALSTGKSINTSGEECARFLDKEQTIILNGTLDESNTFASGIDDSGDSWSVSK